MRFETSNLLAFGFASPVILGWLSLAAVPVLIHWLFRRRYRETTWAAMRFLHEAARKQSRRARLEQLLLLAARILVLVLMVMALARPHWAGPGKFGERTQPTLRVLVLDCSLSMRRLTVRERQTLFEMAQAAARDIVRQANPGDRFLLARIAGSEPRLVIGQPTLNSDAVLDELDRLKPTWERGDVASTLLGIPELLRSKLDAERAEVVLLSDFQTDNWSFSASAQAAWQQVSEVAAIVLLDLGQAAPQNATVMSLSTSPPLVLADQPFSVVVTVRNTGGAALSNRQIDLLIDEQFVESKLVDFSPGQDVSVEFTLTAPSSGDHILAARLSDDALPADNMRWHTLRVRSHIGVILVNGRPAAQPRDAASFFVEQALSPKLRDRTDPRDENTSRWLHVETVREADWPHQDVSRADVVFLCDVGMLTSAEVERLRQFVAAGGGLIVSLGPTVKPANYNEALLGQRGLLPVRLLEHVAVDAGNPQKVIGFDPTQVDHPLVTAFRGNPGAGLETAFIREYLRAALHDDRESPNEPPQSGLSDQSDRPVEVALKFSNGDPAILTHSLGAGRCVLLTTSVDESWGSWAIWAPGFVPLMHELVEYAAGGRSQSREQLIGDAVLVTARSVPTDGNVTLIPPSREPQRLQFTISDATPRLIVRETSTPGTYSLADESSHEVLDQFAVNVDPRESDSKRLTAEEMPALHVAGARVIVRDGANPSPRAEQVANDVSIGMARSVLVAVLALLLVEQCLAWRFDLGIGLAILLSAAWWIETTVGWSGALTISALAAVILLILYSRRMRSTALRAMTR